MRQVRYPGYREDVVELGIVEDISLSSEGGVTVTLREPAEDDETAQSIARRASELLTREFGVKPNFRVRKLAAELGERTGRARIEGVQHVIAVASGKGGVGKSTVAANLAAGLFRLRQRVALFDTDIYGPSVPMMFGTGKARPPSPDGEHIYPIQKHGVSLISMGFFLTDEAPVIWRGPMVMGAVRQLLESTVWGEQDFLVIDLPPGTGDVQLTLGQIVELDGALIVTTPQDVALLDAARAVRMFRELHCPLLGVVENMSYFECPDCGERDDLFGQGGGDRMAQGEHMELLAKLPLYPALRESSDGGAPITFAQPDHPASQTFMALAQRVVEMMPA